MLPLTIAGRKGDDGLDRPAHRHRRAGRPSHAQAGRALRRAAAARGRGPRARLPARRALRRRAHRQPRLAHRRGGPAAAPPVGRRARRRRSSWSPTTRTRRPTPTASLFLKDGAIAHDCGRLGRDDIYDVIKSLEDADDPHRLAQPPGAQAAHVPHHARHPARRGDDQRHLRAHRPDQPAASSTSSPTPTRAPTSPSPARPRSRSEMSGAPPGLPRVAGRPGAGRGRRRRPPYGYVAGSGRRRRATARSSTTGGAPTLFFSYAPQRVSTTTLRRGRPAGRARRGRHHPEARQGQGPRRRLDAHGHHAGRRRARPRVSGVFTFARAVVAGRLDPRRHDARRRAALVRHAGQRLRDRRQGRGRRLARRARRRASARRCRPTPRSRPARRPPPTRPSRSATRSARFLSPALLSFGGIAVFVGAFIIFNAFSMTVAQRRREFAMLRALGRLAPAGAAPASPARPWSWASSPRCSASLAGLGVAAGVIRLFKAVNVDIPHSGLVLAPRTVVVALAVGVVVTLLSAVVPARRATRVPPVAALQEGAALPPSRFARFTPFVAAVVAVLGALGIAAGMYGPGTTTHAARHHRPRRRAPLRRRRHGQQVLRRARWPARSAGRCRSWRRSAAGWRATTASAIPARTAATAVGADDRPRASSSSWPCSPRGSRARSSTASTRSCAPTSSCRARTSCRCPNDTVDRLQAVPGVQTAAGLDIQQVQVDKKTRRGERRRPGAFEQRVAASTGCGGNDALLSQLGQRRRHRRGADRVDARPEGRRDIHRDDASTATQASSRCIGDLPRPDDAQRHRGRAARGYDALFPQPQLFMVFVEGDAGARRRRTDPAAIKTALADVPDGGRADRRRSTRTASSGRSTSCSTCSTACWR